MKKHLREHFINKRDAIPPDEKKRKEEAIEKNLFSLREFRQAHAVLLYVSFRSEVNTMSCLDDVIKSGRRLILPRVDPRKRTLRLFEVKNIEELLPGYMGILEPPIKSERETPLSEIDLVIIPGTGFDLNGLRLGYGGGYYDRLLSYESKHLAQAERHITTIALAFEEQIRDNIPAEPHDIKVDIIVTDKRIIACPGI